MLNKVPHVFISYSQTSEDFQKRVIDLAEHLRNDGVDVKLDIWDLKAGQDIFDFMGQCVTDPTIDKVLIICDSGYAKKADAHKGGVGDEIALILPEVLKDVKQEKFIPVIMEHDENGKPYMPAYLKGRKYEDLVGDNYGYNYRSLLRNIFEQPLYKKPELGAKPKWLCENKSEDKVDSNEIIDDSFKAYATPNDLFHYRITDAFPGVRDLQIFDDPKICVDRLECMLREPLKSQRLQDPIWYFRGGDSLPIDLFERLSDTKCLINSDEYKIKKVAVYTVPSSYYMDFMYIETDADSPSGVNKVPDDLLNNFHYKEFGFYNEEFGLCGDTPITRAEYDDGAAVINGKLVHSGIDAPEFKLRVRYLTPYNFVLCAKWHPFNSSEGDKMTKKYLDGILKGQNTIEEFVKASQCLKKNEKYI